MKSVIKDIKIILLLCLTLGLAPFTPEPHIWQKLIWVSEGAKGMSAIDWFDIGLHGFPWVLLIGFLFRKIYRKISGK